MKLLLYWRSRQRHTIREYGPQSQQASEIRVLKPDDWRWLGYRKTEGTLMTQGISTQYHDVTLHAEGLPAPIRSLPLIPETYRLTAS